MAEKIRDFMTPNPVCVTEKETVRDVARIMAREDTGVVPVCDGKQVIGMITDRDIVVRLVAQGRDPANTRVNEAMTRNVRTIKDDSTVTDALQMMSNAHVKRVAVINDRSELVGIVSIGDIASETKDTDKVGKAVEEISEGPPNN